MDVSEIITAIDEHGFDDRSTDRKVEVINDAYFDAVTREPWPFMERTTTSVTLTSGQITSPSDVLKVLSLYDATHNLRVEPERREYLEKTFGDLSTTGNALYYYPVGTGFYLYPQPTDSPELHLFYIRRPSELTASSLEADILLPARHHRLLVVGAVARLHAMDDDLDLAERFDRQFESRLGSMREDLWMRQYDRPERIYNVQDEYDWGWY